MKYRLLLHCAAALVLLLSLACKKKVVGPVNQKPGELSFPSGGVAMTVGQGWQRIDEDPGPPVCPPTLVGSNGMVRAMLFDADRPDPQTAAATLRKAFQANSDTIQNSFRQEEFTTASGLKGVHLSYSARGGKESTAIEIRSHSYIVKNRKGRCVAITYIVPARRESAGVHQMILKTLKAT